VVGEVGVDRGLASVCLWCPGPRLRKVLHMMGKNLVYEFVAYEKWSVAVVGEVGVDWGLAKFCWRCLGPRLQAEPDRFQNSWNTQVFSVNIHQKHCEGFAKACVPMVDWLSEKLVALFWLPGTPGSCILTSRGVILVSGGTILLVLTSPRTANGTPWVPDFDDRKRP